MYITKKIYINLYIKIRKKDKYYKFKNKLNIFFFII